MSFWCVFKDMNRHLHVFFHLWNNLFWVCLFSKILKIQKWASENPKFCQNYQKSTNVCFCDNSFDKSLVLVLKFIVAVRLFLRKWQYFEFEKKKLIKKKQLLNYFGKAAPGILFFYSPKQKKKYPKKGRTFFIFRNFHCRV